MNDEITVLPVDARLLDAARVGHVHTPDGACVKRRAGRPCGQSSHGMIVDGVGYTPGQIRRLVQERHLLAEENTRLRLSVGRLQRAAESQQVHLQRRTAALVRLIARKGSRLS